MLTVLVTGAAGLIGGEVCARLAARGHRVIGMVRRRGKVLGNDGAPVPLARMVSGDVTLPLMGLNPAELRCDVVIHCAASLVFDAPEPELEAINVEGTRNALVFAKAAGAGFLHVSTAYVCGLEQGAIAEAPVPPGRRFANNYEASKARGEAVVEQSGLPFVIARPSIVLGDHADGTIRDFPTLCNVFRLMARGRLTQFPAAEGATLDLVPICHVAEGIARLAETFDTAQGRHVHLTADRPLPARTLADAVCRQPHLHHPEVVDPAQFDAAVLPRVAQAMLATYGSYFTRDPRFAADNIARLTGLTCPPADTAWIDRLVAYAFTRDYLPSARPDSAAQAPRAHPEPSSARP